ncbi:MAG: Flp pilus assembly complex ATPase component TadA [Candidatus Delongbacteria bacterium]|nr:Flp pilus assembly complex ATPase component TadA [Candidatus Delongbacteria bacterium]MBN2835055.1 Flp pilus assembly complex ATPase component TadA [Candidatus Delongbacteria bacterium]
MSDEYILKASILIVDDDDDLRETLTDVLTFEGFTNTFQAEDGFKAIEIMKTQKVDLVICDLQMPEMDGIETIKRMKEIQPDIKSMIITGFGSMELAIKAFSESRVDDFLSKPIENDELTDKIKQHIANKGNVEEIRSNDMVRGEFGMSENLFGQFLVDNGYLSEEDMIEALQRQKSSGKMLGLTLVDMGLLNEDELVTALSENRGFKVVTDKEFNAIPEDALMLIPESVAKEHTLIPFALDGVSLKVAMINPDDLQVTDTLKIISKKSIIPFLSTREKITDAIEKYYSKLSNTTKASSVLSEIFGDDDIDITELAQDMKDEEDDPDSAPVVKLVSSFLQKAVLDGTSDIHVEPEEDFMKIRFRKDGNLYFPNGYEKLPKKLHNPVVARLKVLTGTMKLDIKKRPQDGKIRMVMGKNKVDFRVASLPTIWGEKVVLRILDATQNNRSVEDIFDKDPNYVTRFKRNIKRRDGMVLVTGPTGSGKTQTLAAAVNYIKDIATNIITIEDPVEITNPGVVQVQIDDKQGLTFASTMRQVLRQDPDVILVGEMRDYETAHTGCEAALTGHLVFSTLHTNDAPSTITRFTEMGIKPYLTGTVVHLILAQRLARRICHICKKEHKYIETDLKGIGLTDDEIQNGKFFKGEGCSNCKGTGQAGRVAIVEMLEMTDRIREAVMEGSNAQEIGIVAKEEGTYFTLEDDAKAKFKKGIIDLEEARKYIYFKEVNA